MHQRLDIRLEKTMKRLELLLQRRFGQQIKVVLDGHTIVKDSSKGLPIEWNKTKLGYIDLANIELNDRDRKMLDDTLDLIVPSLLKGYDDIESLMRIEERSLYMDQRSSQDSAVVDMQSFFRKKITSGLTKPPAEQKWVIETPFLIESRFISDITRMALEIHARTQRFAFLYWHEIDPQYRQQSHSLLQMGTCTLFVPEITNLPKEEQSGLLNLIEIANANSHPLVLAGTAHSYRELLNNPDVNQEFLKKLAQAHLKMEKPYKEYAKAGLLQFIMDGLNSKNLAY